MLYLGIDQHKRQLTVNLRSEDGTVILKRQVSTQWEKVRAFFADLAEKGRPEGGFLAILEVCGMNPWLLEMLKEYGCRETVVVQPTGRSKQKTDRRDAVQLARLMARDCLSTAEALARIRSQMPIEQKKALATRAIDNSGSRESTRHQTLEVYRSLTLLR